MASHYNFISIKTPYQYLAIHDAGDKMGSQPSCINRAQTNLLHMYIHTSTYIIYTSVLISFSFMAYKSFKIDYVAEKQWTQSNI